MNIETFIEQVILEVKDGIESANKKLSRSSSAFIPRALMPESIDFDIAVIRNNGEMIIASASDDHENCSRIKLSISIDEYYRNI